ncbi:MAG TPA: OmpH family outer membrane protein [Flavisolibacter sp.]|nr:OmpH family outer membrane protein [Flavisolibacter sp.]
MKSGMLVLNVVLLILVGILFYWHFSAKNKPVIVSSRNDTLGNSNQFRIAYFEMDSVSKKFAMVKDVKSELSKEEDRMNANMSRLQKLYNDKLNQYQSQASQMNQVQSEAANRDMLQLQETIRGQKQDMDQKYQDLTMRKTQDVKSKIQDFLKEYNKTKGYSYIFSNEAGFIYYTDTAYNITNDLIKGLNEEYLKKK